MKKSKRVVIKEELVALTGDYKLAIVLNQMIYWSERVRDFDDFIKEERSRLEKESIDTSAFKYRNGWIYKTAEDLAEECMITTSKATMGRYLDKLVEKEWLLCRKNPDLKWDKTLQYRINITKIQKDLFKLGYVLDGYRIDLLQLFQNDTSRFQNETSEFQNDTPKYHNETAIPEITTEITSDIKKEEEEGVTEDQKMNLFTFYEQNGFGKLGKHIAQKIIQWSEVLSWDIVLEAMKMAVENGGKNWSYIESILTNWDSKKVKTVHEACAQVIAYKKQQSKLGGRKTKQTRSTRTETIPDWYYQKDTPSQPKESFGDEYFDFEKEKAQLEKELKKFT